MLLAHQLDDGMLPNSFEVFCLSNGHTCAYCRQRSGLIGKYRALQKWKISKIFSDFIS